MSPPSLPGWLRVLAVALPVAAATAGAAPPAAPVTALEYHPGGGWIAVGRPGAVESVARGAGGGSCRVDVPLPRVAALAFVPGGRFLLAAGGRPGESGTVVRIDSAGGGVPETIGRGDDLIAALAASAARGHVAWADGPVIHLLRGGDPAEAGTVRMTGHAAAVRSLAFSPDGTLLVSAGLDRAVKVWSVDDGRELRSFGHHTEAVQAVAFAPAGGGPAVCATAGDDRTVRVWQPAPGRMVRIVRHHPGAVLGLAWSPAGDALFSVGTEGVLRRIDAGSDRILAEIPASSDVLYRVAVSPDGAELAVAGWSGRVLLWDAATGASRGEAGADADPR